MKTVITSFVLVLSFLLASFGTTHAQARYMSSITTPASVVQFYKNYKQSGGSKCIAMSFATNQVSKETVSFKTPTSTWGSGYMFATSKGIKSVKTKRYWSSRFDGNQPFATNKTDIVELVLNKVGNQVVAKLIKNGSTTFNVQILGVVAKGKGHILYGTYGNHGGFITISLYKTYCPVG